MIREIAKVAIPIRRPVSEVFKAFVEPAVITKFWLASTSGPLAKHATVQWHFMVPGAIETVTVLEFEINRFIAFTWSNGINVVMNFAPYDGAATLLSIEASGFRNGDLEAMVNTTEGFSIVLCDLKTLLETGRSADLVKDKAEFISRNIVHTSQKNET